MSIKERPPVGTWKPFNKFDYIWAWKHHWYVFGIIRQFFKDIKYAYQRVVYGYCEYDLFSIFDWFLNIMPRMLYDFKETRHGSPSIFSETCTEKCISDNENEENLEDCHKKWDEILDKIIFLFMETSEETCQKKNPFEEEHLKVFSEFEEKYGFFGRKLETEEEKKRREEEGLTTIHFTHEVPEYKEIENKYFEEEKKLENYRVMCKDEAFKLFSKWFFNLWD